MIGRTLAHYTIVAKIGEGGMGEVYRARDTKLNRDVALKVLPPDMAKDPDRRKRFKREAQTVAALKHPNIVMIHSVESAGDTHFLTMELVEGKTLSELIPDTGFSLDRFFELAVPLTDAVASAHARGITHRDLKPANIMVDADGRLKVLDFGLAKLLESRGPDDGARTEAGTVALDSSLTAEGHVLGTVAYMSPEQTEAKAIDHRTDIFSLGIILYEMLTGRRPFQGDNAASIVSAILRDTPSSVTELKPALPRHIGRIVRRCLAKDPDRRYQTALDLRNELEELKAEVDSGALAVESRRSVAQPTRSPMTLVLLGVLAVVLVAAVYVVNAWLRPDSPAISFTSRPLTATTAWSRDPNWSPEGEFIAFGGTASGSMDILVKPVAGGEAVVRAGGPGDQTTPRWSPDGKYLAYVSGSEPGTFIFLVPPHGGSPRRLIRTDVPTLDLQRVHQVMGDRPWSRDSRTLLVSRVTSMGQLAVYRVGRDDDRAEQLTFPPVGSDDVRASHSFDGERIVFTREIDGRGVLMTVSAAGGDPETLLADGFTNKKPAWRPDNRHVVFESDRGSRNRNLWEIDVITGSTRQLTFETNTVEGFSVSSDNRIVYAPFWHDTFLFTISVESGKQRQLTSHTKDNFGGRYSPDDQTVAYHSTRTGNSEIWLHHLDGRPETQVTDHPGWDLYPEWSPDGQRLIFVSDRDGQFKVFIANRDGGDVRLLVDQPISLPAQSPVNRTLICRWSPDGEQIAYLVVGDETDALWTIRPDGSGGRKRLDNVTGFDWYRTSRQAVITRRRGSEEEIIAVDLETGREQTLFVGALTEFDVAPDGSAVAFCFGRGHLAMGLALLRLEPSSESGGLPRAGSEPEYVARSEGTWHVHNGGWSTDSKSLVYTRDQDYGDVYELVERR